MNTLDWLWRVVVVSKKKYICAIIILFFESLALISTIFLQKILIDDVILGSEYKLFFLVVVFMSVAYIAHSLFFTLGAYLLYRNISDSLLKLSEGLMTYFHITPIKILQKKRTGDYITYFSHDIENVSGLTGYDIPRFLQQTFSCLLLFFIIGNVSFLILILVILLSLIYIKVGVYFNRSLRKVSRILLRRKSKIIVKLEECVSSTKEVIIFNREQWEFELLSKIFNNYIQLTKKEESIKSRQLITGEPIVWGASLVVLGISGYSVYNGTMTMGNLVIIFQFSTHLMNSLKSSYEYIVKINKRAPSIKRLREEVKVDNLDVVKSIEIKNIKGPVTIKFKNVNFSYKKEGHLHLKNLNINLFPGKKIALVGTSGSGKSTILQLISKLHNPTSGQIELNGIPLVEIPNKELYEHISIVFQEPYLFPGTIRENILLGYQANDNKVKKACKIVEIDSFISSLPKEYDTEIGERGITLSGGQRQRLALARAIIRNPEILVLDEATSALDIITEEKVMRNLDTLRVGKTTVIVAHRLNTVENADIIYVLDGGSVCDHGTHTELIKKSKFYKKLVYQQTNSTKILLTKSN